MDCLYIVMPAYNEEKNIRNTIDQWYPMLSDKNDNSRLVVADSGSSDKTHEILLELQKKYPKIIILDTENKYHGPKLIALYKYAISNGADFVFQTDSDGQTNPVEFLNFWAERDKYDGIFGYRKVRGDGAIRAFVEKVVCFLVFVFFSVKVPDANAPFRLMKSSILNKYLDKMADDYNLPNIMITTFFKYYGDNIIFKEITFKPRSAGKNSINLKKIFLIGFKSLKDFNNFKKEM